MGIHFIRYGPNIGFYYPYYNMMKLLADRNTAFPGKSPFEPDPQKIKTDNVLYLFVKQEIITAFAHFQT
jgi:hypothetical protein